jgi:hypothetical protein
VTSAFGGQWTKSNGSKLSDQPARSKAEARLQGAYQSTLCLRIPVNAPLGRINGRVAGQQLHVAQRAAATVDVSGCRGDERALARVRRTAVEAAFNEEDSEPIDDAVGAERAGADRRAGEVRYDA